MLGSTSRKPLIRSNSHSDRTTMRNWPLFMFLMGLVLFFYVFYVYQAQNASLNLATEEISKLNSQLVQSKNKVVDAMAELETTRSEKNKARLEADAALKNQEECSINLRSSKLRLDTLEKDRTEFQGQASKYNTELAETKTKLEEAQQNATSMARIIATQEALISQLNQTINLLKAETKSDVTQPIVAENRAAPEPVTKDASEVKVQADAQAHLLAQPEQKQQPQEQLADLAKAAIPQDSAKKEAEEEVNTVAVSTPSVKVEEEDGKEEAAENENQAQVDEPKVAEIKEHGEDKDKDFQEDQQQPEKPKVNGGEYEDNT